jgi:hypothetical protein
MATQNDDASLISTEYGGHTHCESLTAGTDDTHASSGHDTHTVFDVASLCDDAMQAPVQGSTPVQFKITGSGSGRFSFFSKPMNYPNF